MKVVRINLVAGRWWLQPSPWTFSRSSWSPRVYGSLSKLLDTEKLDVENVIISINKDRDLNTFRALQQMKNLKVFLNKKEIFEITSGGFFDHKVPKKKIILRFDKKSLRHLRAGFLPFVSAEYLWSERKVNREADYHVFLWRKEGFVEITEKIQKTGGIDALKFRQDLVSVT